VKKAGLFVALGACLALASCGDPRPDPERTLQKIGARPRAFTRNCSSPPTGHYFLPKLASCPPTFRRFRPLHVRAYPDGFALALHDGRGVEQGLYVVPLGMETTPRESRNARFERIDDGVHWYWFQE